MKSRCLLVNLAKYRDITGKSTNFSWFNHHGQRFGEKRSRRLRLGQRVDAHVEAAMQRAKESGGVSGIPIWVLRPKPVLPHYNHS